MKDWKGTISTICGIVAAIAGALVTASQTGLVLPTWLVALCGAMGTICLAIIGILTGRNPDLTAKTSKQVNAAIGSK